MIRTRITFLGSGTSMGVPTIGCRCRVCHSSDPHDRRTRPSLLLQYAGHAVVIDTTPDFREQALRVGLQRLDAVLYTHGHADHILGLDDIRPFNIWQGRDIPIYANQETLDIIRHTFRYIFGQASTYSTVPGVATHLIDGPLALFGVTFTPVPAWHGEMEVLGFRFGRAAYMTDFHEIPESSPKMLEDLDVLVLDALRHEPHPTHSNVAQSLLLVERLRPRQTFFTHICHDLPHEETNRALPADVQLAYDGLTLEVEA